MSKQFEGLDDDPVTRQLVGGHTDFIFSVLSEEFGLFGVCILLSLYLFITFPYRSNRSK